MVEFVDIYVVDIVAKYNLAAVAQLGAGLGCCLRAPLSGFITLLPALICPDLGLRVTNIKPVGDGGTVGVVRPTRYRPPVSA